MKVSYYNLKKLVDFDYSPEDLSARITQLGLEVSSIDSIGENLQNIFVGKVIEKKSHPSADKLSVCRVDTAGKVYDVVCGAPNVAEGQIVSIAVPGAVLPGGHKITIAKIRGIQSEGMICSEKELGLGDDATGIMVLDDSFEIGSQLCDVAGLRDWIIEIDLTPNRPDCLSLLGVAREIGVISNSDVRKPDLSPFNVDLNKEDTIKVTIDDADLCENYSAYIIRGVKVASSPFWLVNAVEKLGMRSINNIVDVTNYILVEMGHPLHAFDLKKIKGAEIVVRRAKSGENIITLDKKERVLDDSMLVIADAEDPIAIAGVMGGAESEVDENTSDILLEGAYFNPVSVRKTSKKIGLSTEASYRFERGTDRIGFKDALKRAAYLIAGFGKAASISDLIENNAKDYEKKSISCNIDRINSYLGIEVSAEQMLDILEKLQITIRERDGSNLLLEPPSFRIDLDIEEDIVEEIARVYGYDEIPMIYPGSEFVEYEVNKKLFFSQITQDILAGAGFYDTMSCSLLSMSATESIPSFFIEGNHQAVCVMNPISEMQHALQTSLVPNLLNIVSLNSKNRVKNIKIFEIANVFIPTGDGESDEKLVLGLSVSGNTENYFWGKDSNKWDFFSFKGFLEDYFDVLGIKWLSFSSFELPYCHPGRTACLLLGKKRLGYLGQIHPMKAKELDIDKDTFIAEFDASMMIQSMNIKGSYTPLPKYPASERDLAIVVGKDVSYQKINSTLNQSLPGLLEDFMLVSTYEGEQIGDGKASLNFRMRYRSVEKTLKDKEVDSMHNKLAQILVENLGCELR